MTTPTTTTTTTSTTPVNTEEDSTAGSGSWYSFIPLWRTATATARFIGGTVSSGVETVKNVAHTAAHPVQASSEALVEGLAQGTTSQAHQLSASLRWILRDALLRKVPEPYERLLEEIKKCLNEEKEGDYFFIEGSKNIARLIEKIDLNDLKQELSITNPELAEKTKILTERLPNLIQEIVKIKEDPSGKGKEVDVGHILGYLQDALRESASLLEMIKPGVLIEASQYLHQDLNQTTENAAQHLNQVMLNGAHLLDKVATNAIVNATTIPTRVIKGLQGNPMQRPPDLVLLSSIQQPAAPQPSYQPLPQQSPIQPGSQPAPQPSYQPLPQQSPPQSVPQGGAQPSQSIPPLNSPPQGQQSALPNSLGSLLDNAHRFVNMFFNWGSDALFFKLADTFASMLQMGLEYAKSSMQDDPLQKKNVSVIDPILQTLDQARKEGTRETLMKGLRSSFEQLEPIRMFINGIFLPFKPQVSHPSAIPTMFGQLKRLATPTDPLAQPLQITQAMIREQGLCFSAKSSSSSTFHLLASLLRIQIDPTSLAEVWESNITSSLDELNELFKTKLFQKIENSNHNFIIKWLFKVLYSPLHKIVKFYISSIINNFVDKAIFLTSNHPQAPQNKQEWVIELLREWLAKMSGAYNEVAQMPPEEAEGFDHMMKKAVQNPKRNGGFTQKELLSNAIKILIDRFSPQITWYQSIDLYFSKQLPETSYFAFLNPLYKAFNLAFSLILKAVTFLPQWVGNWIIQGAAKLTVSQTSLLERYFEEKSASFQANSPTSFGMQTMLYKELERVLQIVQQKLNDPAHSTPYSLRKEMDLKQLVKYLLEVVEKSPYNTQDEQKKYQGLEGRRLSPLEELTRTIEKIFDPEAIKYAVQLFGIALDTLTDEKDAHALLYEGLCVANRSFSQQIQVSEQDFISLEQGIAALSNELLLTTITHAAEHAFDASNEKQLNALNQYITTFYNDTVAFCENLYNDCGQLNSPETLNVNEIALKTTQMRQRAQQFVRTEISLLGAKGYGHDDLHSIIKQDLNELSIGLTTLSDPLIDLLKAIELMGIGLANMHQIKEKAIRSQHVLDHILLPITENQPSLEVIQSCQERLSLVQKDLSDLKNGDGLSSQIDFQFLSQSVKNIETHFDTIAKYTILIKHLSDLSPLFRQLQKEKGVISSPIPTEYELNQKIQQLPLLNKQEKNELQAALLHFMEKNDPALFQKIINQMTSHSQRMIKDYKTIAKNTLYSIRPQFKKIENLQESQIKNQLPSLTTSLQGVQKNYLEIYGWVAKQTGPIICNVKAFDTTWLTHAFTVLAFNRAKVKSRTALEFFRTGFVHQALGNQLALRIIKDLGSN